MQRTFEFKNKTAINPKDEINLLSAVWNLV